MLFASGLSIVAVSTLPAASSHSGEFFTYQGHLWVSNGVNWVQIRDNVVSNYAYRSLVNPRIFKLEYRNAATSSTVDLGGPGSGKRWRVSAVISNFGGSSPGTGLTFQARIKISGSYYGANRNLTSGGVTTSWQGVGIPIIENGEQLAISCASVGGGSNFFFLIEEFSTDSPLKSVKFTSLSSGDNTVYTCPSGFVAVTGCNAINTGAWVDLPELMGALHYSNRSGGTRTLYTNHVLSGGSPSAPGAGSNSFMGAAATTLNSSSTAGTGVITLPIPKYLTAGESINLNTNAATATQFGYFNVCEYPV